MYKETIAVAIAEDRRGGEVRYLGEIANRREMIRKPVTKLSKSHDALHFCYEAGPCGYGIHRQLTEMGHDCELVALSLTPSRPGDRVKTDRRDAVLLARLHRAGELTRVWVPPDEGYEAVRDLVRARTAAMENLRRARQQLSGFLLRHDRVFRAGCNWTKKHRGWLAKLRFGHLAIRLCFKNTSMRSTMPRPVLPEPRFKSGRSFQPGRGHSGHARRWLHFGRHRDAETGDISRFDNPRQLVNWLGLVPSEYSSGPRTARGGITKARSKDARRVRIEGAWTYHAHATVGPMHMERLEGLPKEVRDIAWKAQVWLCAPAIAGSSRAASPQPSSSPP